MTETIVNFFIEIFSNINKNLLIFIVSLLPIVELRPSLTVVNQ